MKAQELFLKALLQRVVVRHDTIDVQMNASMLLQSLQDGPANTLSPSQRVSDNHEPQIFSLSCPFQQSRYGNELRLILGNDQSDPTRSNTAIIRAIARARLRYDEIVSGEVGGIPDLARRHRVTRRYVKNILRCAFAGPKAVEAILSNECRPELTLQNLANRMPIEWDKQFSILRGE